MNRKSDRNAEIFGWIITILLTSIVFVLFVLIPIVLNIGIIYLLSFFPLVNFTFYPDFWSNLWFFSGFTILNISILALSEILITIDRKQTTNELSGFGPNTFLEWTLHILVFSVYINVFDVYSERFTNTILGSIVISISIVCLFNIIEIILNKFQNTNKSNVQ